jgi:hypothetical protein
VHSRNAFGRLTGFQLLSIAVLLTHGCAMTSLELEQSLIAFCMHSKGYRLAALPLLTRRLAA